MKTADADRFSARPPKALGAVLVFGPDQGLVRERAESLVKSVTEDLKDPFRVCELGEADLVGDTARLFDEAAALSMVGGRRVIRVREAGNGLAKLFEAFLENRPGDALVVVEAGDLAKGTGLRRVFENHPDAASIACYPDSALTLSDVVRDVMKRNGLSIAADVLDSAVSRLGSDRGVTRNELEKLALYAHGQKSVSLDDVDAALSDEAEVRVEDACDAAGTGDIAALDVALERLRIADTSAVAILRMAMAHFQRVGILRAEVGKGGNLEAALKRLRPQVHFQRSAAMKAQVARWDEEKIGEALDLLLDAEAMVKTTGVPEEAACGRALFSVAAIARRR
ncbi:MAG: DNA polymerase III subunit delta [Alphaproteobacteria bacterium]|nr:DNA polymerase III subunit delta [Alphaproteobacteria bacterium]